MTLDPRQRVLVRRKVEVINPRKTSFGAVRCGVGAVSVRPEYPHHGVATRLGGVAGEAGGVTGSVAKRWQSQSESAGAIGVQGIKGMYSHVPEAKL